MSILLVLRRRIEYGELFGSIGLEAEYAGEISASVAVVRSGPYCDEPLVKHEFVALLDELMGSGDERQAVDAIEL